MALLRIILCGCLGFRTWVFFSLRSVDFPTAQIEYMGPFDPFQDNKSVDYGGTGTCIVALREADWQEKSYAQLSGDINQTKFPRAGVRI
jgi:hypothetical protein